jgi:hypothetical protein
MAVSAAQWAVRSVPWAMLRALLETRSAAPLAVPAQPREAPSAVLQAEAAADLGRPGIGDRQYRADMTSMSGAERSPEVE